MASPPSVPTGDPRIGTILNGRYRIVAHLAEGSMGAVYRAERLGIGRAVAVKFLHGSFVSDRQFTRRFEREALAMSRLTHPHCVPVIDFGVVDNTPYVIMDLVEGKTLSDILQDGPLHPERAIRLTAQILSGLEHSHRKDIVHRDVKPANVIVSEYSGVGEHARLVDFGLAKMPRAHSDLTETQIAVGTPTYMSPEQSRGDKVDPRADVYGVGVLLFRMLTGKRPFDADDTATMLLLHREAPIPSLKDRGGTLTFSDDLERVVARALAKEPGKRFASALAFSQALAEVPEMRGARTPARKKTRRTMRWNSAAQTRTAVILAAACVAVAWLGPIVRGNGAAPLTVPADAGTVTPAKRKEPAPSHKVVQAPRPRPAPPRNDVFLVYGPPPEPPKQMVGPPVPLPGEMPEATEELAIVSNGEAETAKAIEALESLRKVQPNSAYLPYTLGRLYSEQGDYPTAVDCYADALEQSSDYRNHALLNRNVIRALAIPASRGVARGIILGKLKRAAVPHLVRAVKSDPDPVVRDQAKRLLERIRRGS